jgi:hypothetical protein
MTSHGLTVHRKTFSLLVAGLLSACGGGTAQAPGETVLAAAPNTQQVVGLWTPAGGSARPAFEFFGSATESPYDKTLRTGRLWQDRQVASLFVWSLQNDGTITLNLVSPSCASRPLSSCAVTGTARITASGKRTQDSSWNIDFDNDGDGKVDARSADTYHRQEIDLSSLGEGEFFLTRLDNAIFDGPMRGAVSGTSLSLRLEDLDRPMTASASGFAGKRDTLALAAGESAAVTVNQNFYVVGSGYRIMPVKQWFDQVSLSASNNGAYALSFEMHRQVQLPDGVTRAQVQIDSGSSRAGLADYEAVTSSTQVVGLIDRFISAPSIRSQDRFYVSLDLNFTRTGEANDLLFTSATEGMVTSRLAHHPDAVSEQRSFTWRQRADGAVVLSFAAYGDVVLHFIKAISGGYQVLYERPDTGFGASYRVRDFLRDAAPVLDASNLAGRYVFSSTAALPSGSHEYSVTFHRNHTVSGAVGGYWFQDANGDLVGYECTDTFGRDISDYATCAAALDNTASVNFAHVRRLRFVNRDGNALQARYNASVYGTRTFLFYPPSGDPVRASKFFTAVGAPVQSTALTYRFVRVGDE